MARYNPKDIICLTKAATSIIFLDELSSLLVSAPLPHLPVSCKCAYSRQQTSDLCSCMLQCFCRTDKGHPHPQVK